MAYKILIVDDERALCEMIRAFLAQAGYATATAGSCAEALTVFRAEQPDAVLLDVMLPDGDGFSLFGQLRALRDVPTLFLSPATKTLRGCRDSVSAPTITSPSPSCRRSCCCDWPLCCAAFIAMRRKMTAPVSAMSRSTGARALCAGMARKFR